MVVHLDAGVPDSPERTGEAASLFTRTLHGELCRKALHKCPKPVYLLGGGSFAIKPKNPPLLSQP